MRRFIQSACGFCQIDPRFQLQVFFCVRSEKLLMIQGFNYKDYGKYKRLGA